MPVLIRHLWQLKTVVLLHWCLIHAVLLQIQYRPSHKVCLFKRGIPPEFVYSSLKTEIRSNSNFTSIILSLILGYFVPARTIDNG
jgi:hypothetical protein